jgi:hypothetical protein
VKAARPARRVGRAASLNGPQRRRGGASAVPVVRPDPEVWATALRLAQGDPRRCHTDQDGSVVVLNGPR